MSTKTTIVLELTTREAELLSTALLHGVHWSTDDLGEAVYQIWFALDAAGVQVDERYSGNGYAKLEYKP
jgi:hypothetical protein